MMFFKRQLFGNRLVLFTNNCVKSFFESILLIFIHSLVYEIRNLKTRFLIKLFHMFSLKNTDLYG